MTTAALVRVKRAALSSEPAPKFVGVHMINILHNRSVDVNRSVVQRRPHTDCVDHPPRSPSYLGDLSVRYNCDCVPEDISSLMKGDILYLHCLIFI